MAAAYGFFREQEPLELRSARTMGLVGTWMGAWLTGEVAIDPTQAAYTGC
jgi:xylulokinase